MLITVFAFWVAELEVLGGVGFLTTLGLVVGVFLSDCDSG